MNLNFAAARPCSKSVCLRRRQLALICLWLLFICLTLNLCGAFAESSTPDQSWRVNTQTVEGRVTLLLSILKRDPAFFTRETSFSNRMGSVLAAADKIGPEVNPEYNLIGPTLRIAMNYEGQYKDFDWMKTEALRDHIKARYERLLNAGLKLPSTRTIDEEFSNLIETTKPLLQLPNGERRRWQRLVDFLVAAPYLYFDNGHPLIWPDLPRAIDSSSILEIKESYTDLFGLKLAPHLFYPSSSQGFLDQVRSRFENQFFNRELMSALIKVKKTVHGSITLEEVPKIVALLRALPGEDCDMDSIPLYVLHPAVRVFWIRKQADFETTPIGYVLAVETDVPHQNRKRPVILTVNGNPEQLDMGAARGAALALNALYGSNDTILVSQAQDLVNTHLMKEGLWYSESKRAQPVEVELPDNWDVFGRAWKRQRRYPDYYSRKRLDHSVFEIALDESEIKLTESLTRLSEDVVPYPEVQDSSQFTLFARATLALLYRSARKALGVTRDEFEAARTVADGHLYYGKRVNYTARTLGFSVSELFARMKLRDATLVYVDLHGVQADKVSEQDMAQIREDLLARIDVKVRQFSDLSESEQWDLWRSIVTMGRGPELWPKLYSQFKKDRDKSLKDVFTQSVLEGPEAQDLLMAASQILGRKNILIYRLVSNLIGHNRISEPVWKWAVMVSSLPILPDDVYNRDISKFNFDLKESIGSFNPPRWLLERLILNLPPLSHCIEQSSYECKVLERKYWQIDLWARHFEPILTESEAEKIGQLLLKAIASPTIRTLLFKVAHSRRLWARAQELNSPSLQELNARYEEWLREDCKETLSR